MGADMSNMGVGNPVNSFDAIEKARSNSPTPKGVTNTSKVPDLPIDPVLPTLATVSSENSDPITKRDVKDLKGLDELSAGKVKSVSNLVPRKPLASLDNHGGDNNNSVSVEVAKKNRIEREE